MSVLILYLPEKAFTRQTHTRIWLVTEDKELILAAFQPEASYRSGKEVKTTQLGHSMELTSHLL